MNEKLNYPPWNSNEIAQKAEEFYEIYKNKPIKDNQGGMLSAHMFALWFILKKLKPKIVVENGIWKGQSTWLIRQACPKAQIYSFDVTLEYRQHIEKGVIYNEYDFTDHDWTEIDTNQAVIFFDDHQNAYNRLVWSYFFGFKHLIFEDNFFPNTGDCYSMKQIFAQSGFQPKKLNFVNKSEILCSRIIRKISGKCGFSPVESTPQYHKSIVKPNKSDKNNVLNKINTYYEFPPLFKPEKNSEEQKWEHKKFPTPPAIFEKKNKEKFKTYWQESYSYSWFCYVGLKTFNL